MGINYIIDKPFSTGYNRGMSDPRYRENTIVVGYNEKYMSKGDTGKNRSGRQLRKKTCLICQRLIHWWVAETGILFQFFTNDIAKKDDIANPPLNGDEIAG